jgi:hypothetical protein
MKVPATERAGTSQPNQKVYNTAAGGENDFAAGKAQAAQIAKKRALPGGVTDSLTSWSEAGWPGQGAEQTTQQPVVPLPPAFRAPRIDG